MNVWFQQLNTPTPEIAAILNEWENNPELIPFIRPCRNRTDIEARTYVTVESLAKRLEHQLIFLIYAAEQLVGEMSVQIDPDHLFKKEVGTAWIGIGIGEASVRGMGVGTKAMEYLEKQILTQGLSRIELGVFAFNTRAVELYKKMGYQEIGRLDDFTYWQGRMWQDIRMEKYLK